MSADEDAEMTWEFESPSMGSARRELAQLIAEFHKAVQVVRCCGLIAYPVDVPCCAQLAFDMLGGLEGRVMVVSAQTLRSSRLAQSAREDPHMMGRIQNAFNSMMRPNYPGLPSPPPSTPGLSA